MLRIQENVELAPLTTFHVKAKARFFATFTDENDLIELFSDSRFRDQKKFYLGGGSNTLFTGDFDGVVIQCVSDAVRPIDENDSFRFVQVDAGCVWHRFVLWTLENNLAGLENLALIPGTIGGAAIQNIGAYGVEVAERIHEVRVFNPETLSTETLPVDQCDYGYRSSVFKTKKRNAIVLSVSFALLKTFTPVVSYKAIAHFFENNPPKSPREVADCIIATRREKLPDPDQIGSAGSFFKNPIVSRVKMNQLLEETPQLVAYPLAGSRAKLAAGWLIDAVGMKGKRVKDAGVYDKNALVLVNYGKATGEEILSLANQIKSRVKDRFGVELEPEPIIL